MNSENEDQDRSDFSKETNSTKRTSGKGRKAPPPADASRYQGDRKIPEMDSERTGGRELSRRSFLSVSALGWAGFASVVALTSAATGRFFLPNVLENPPEVFAAGRVEDYPPETVSLRYLSRYRVWIVNLTDRLVAILAICTHLGCTPNWLEGSRIFSCPCHGSGFRMNGVNFEGPAPRPMDRVGIRLTPEGTVLVDKSQVFSHGATPGWEHDEAYIPL